MVRVLYPLFENEISTDMIKVNDLDFEICPKLHSVDFVRAYHSRLPKCQSGPWMYSFRSHYKGTTVAVALWNNPSARTLPSDWLELRRLACSPDAPKNTCSRFISWMVKYFKKNRPDIKKIISYQDTESHAGIIYKASNWYIDYICTKRIRDRSKPRKNTNRAYRSNLNSDGVDAAQKIRWAYDLDKPCKNSFTPVHKNRNPFEIITGG